MKRLVVAFSLIITMFVMITEGSNLDVRSVDDREEQTTTNVVEFEEPRIYQEINGYWSPCLFGV